jgi:hypothetical protein
MTDAKRQLLQRLADAGKPTTLVGDDLELAKLLEAEELVLIVGNTTDAIITPRGRHSLTTTEIGERPSKKPFGFTD